MSCIIVFNSHSILFEVGYIRRANVLTLLCFSCPRGCAQRIVAACFLAALKLHINSPHLETYCSVTRRISLCKGFVFFVSTISYAQTLHVLTQSMQGQYHIIQYLFRSIKHSIHSILSIPFNVIYHICFQATFHSTSFHSIQHPFHSI